MVKNICRALVALTLLGALSGLLSACGNDYEPMQYAMACMDEGGNRAPNEYCGGDMMHPRPHYSSAWGHIADDGFYEPAYGRPLTGWSRQRPVNYTVRNTIINTGGGGGTLRTDGGGTASAGATLGSGKRIPAPPKGYSAVSSGRKDNAPSGGSPNITRGGLGVPSSSSSASKSSAGSASSSSGSKSSSSSSSSGSSSKSGK